MANRLAAMAGAEVRAGRDPGNKGNYCRVINTHGRWNGRVCLVEDAVDAPKAWKAERTVFVNSMSDLFHEGVPIDFIKRVFHTMNDCPQHTFQILTKRPDRAAEVAVLLDWTDNIWMGTSVENGMVANRIAKLRKIPAHVRFLSVEPLIGPIPKMSLTGIHWVIVGGESGPGARPMRIEWVRRIRDRCRACGVPFFFKQWGGTNKKKAGRILDGRTWDEMPNGRRTVSREVERGRRPARCVAS
jgi:protein gp37